MNIADNLSDIRNKINEYEKKYNRKENSVRLLAVSKKQSIDAIKAAYDAGQKAFGENYLQEALPKIEASTSLNIEWHFIGPIQRNKTKKIAEHFSWVHSVDNILIAKRLSEQRPPHLPPLNICIQVNVDNEETKAGVSASDALLLVQACTELPNIIVRGLMTIPAPTDDTTKQRHAFHALQLLFQQCIQAGFNVDTLSMGMSHDFEAAIEEGATIIRIGTAIFGERI